MKKLFSTLILVLSLTQHHDLVSAAKMSSEEKELEQKIFPVFHDITVNTQVEKDLLKKCKNGDIDSLFSVARTLEIHNNENLGNTSDDKDVPGGLLGQLVKSPFLSASLPLDIFTYLADFKDHASSQAKMGHYHSMISMTMMTPEETQKSTETALSYYKLAGENGHHQSLYNAGLILFEGATGVNDLVGSMAYFQAAATLHYHFGEKNGIDDKITNIAREAHGTTAVAAVKLAINNELSFEEIADLFIFSSLDPPPPPDTPNVYREELVQTTWEKAVRALISFSSRKSKDTKQLLNAKVALEKLVDINKEASENSGRPALNNFQLFMILNLLVNYVFVHEFSPSSSSTTNNNDYDIGIQYAISLSENPLCYLHYESSKAGDSDSNSRKLSCFNGAISSALSFAQAKKSDGRGDIEQILDIAKSHPHASSYWVNV